jgi:hypothetical protein
LGGSAVAGKYTGDLGDGPIQVVVDHDVVGQLAADRFLLPPECDPPVDLFGRIPPPAHPVRLVLHRRGHDENHDGLGIERFDLPGSFYVDLEQQIGARRRLGTRSARQLPRDNFGPFEKSSLVGRGLETGPVDEAVRVVALARPAGSRRPGAAEPQPVVRIGQAFDDGSLADPTRAGDDDNQS